MQTITMIIGVLMILILLIPFGIKQYFSNQFIDKKTKKSKILIRTVNQTEQEHPVILAMQGSATEPSKSGKAYIPKGKQEVTLIDNNGKEIKIPIGNTFETWYPEGLPRILQTRVRAMATPEHDPSGINFYSENPNMATSSDQIALIQAEKYSKNAIAASDDSAERFEAIQKMFKGGLNSTAVYIMLGIIVIGIIAVAYLGYVNMTTIQELKWW
jgi:hypothetical protein